MRPRAAGPSRCGPWASWLPISWVGCASSPCRRYSTRPIFGRGPIRHLGNPWGSAAALGEEQGDGEVGEEVGRDQGGRAVAVLGRQDLTGEGVAPAEGRVEAIQRQPG